MNKLEYNFINGKYKTVKYGKRYGYWWKVYKLKCQEIKDFYFSVDYFGNIEYKILNKISPKLFHSWTKNKFISLFEKESAK